MSAVRVTFQHTDTPINGDMLMEQFYLRYGVPKSIARKVADVAAGRSGIEYVSITRWIKGEWRATLSMVGGAQRQFKIGARGRLLGSTYIA